MVLIGIFMIVEMIVFIFMAFMLYLLQSSMTADMYRPVVGKRPFADKDKAFLSRQVVNEQPWKLK